MSLLRKSLFFLCLVFVSNHFGQVLLENSESYRFHPVIQSALPFDSARAFTLGLGSEYLPGEEWVHHAKFSTEHSWGGMYSSYQNYSVELDKNYSPSAQSINTKLDVGQHLATLGAWVNLPYFKPMLGYSFFYDQLGSSHTMAHLAHAELMFYWKNFYSSAKVVNMGQPLHYRRDEESPPWEGSVNAGYHFFWMGNVQVNGFVRNRKGMGVSGMYYQEFGPWLAAYLGGSTVEVVGLPLNAGAIFRIQKTLQLDYSLAYRGEFGYIHALMLTYHWGMLQSPLSERKNN